MEQVDGEDADALEFTAENIDSVLDEIRCAGVGSWAAPPERPPGLGEAMTRPTPGWSFPVFPLPRVAVAADETRLPPPPQTRALATQSHRPYLVGTGGGGLELAGIDGTIAQVRITGPAAAVMTVRVAVTQKLRERIPSIGAVQIVD